METVKNFMILSGVLFWLIYTIQAVSYIICVLFRAIESKTIKKRERKYIIENHIKCKALCNACEYEHYCADRSNDCEACGQYDVKNICKCYEIDNGEECPYFKPIESEVNNNEN